MTRVQWMIEITEVPVNRVGDIVRSGRNSAPVSDWDMMRRCDNRGVATGEKLRGIKCSIAGRIPRGVLFRYRGKRLASAGAGEDSATVVLFNKADGFPDGARAVFFVLPGVSVLQSLRRVTISRRSGRVRALVTFRIASERL